jgi:hypothetical protein
MTENVDEDEYIPVEVVKISDLLAVEAPIARAQLLTVDSELDEGE